MIPNNNPLAAILHTPGGVGDFLTQTKGAQTVHLYQDGQGSTRIVTNQIGMPTQTHSYDAFVNQVTAFGQVPTNTDIKHLYVGEYFNQEANLYHMRARDYSPAVGRFTNMDGFEGEQKRPLTLNKYLYSNADPINQVDPSGFMTLADSGAASAGHPILSTMAINTMMMARAICRTFVAAAHHTIKVKE